MTNIKTLCFGVILSMLLVASIAHSDTAIYTLDDLQLNNGNQITGTFVWTYDVDDFEGGSGEFTALEIPYTIYSLADGNLNIDIQSGSIEISGNGNYHDVGLDITIALSQPLSLTQSAPIDLGLSFFECCGNGFQDQFFQGGSISPAPPLECDIQLNKATYVDGDIVTAEVFRVANLTAESQALEWKVWVGVPGIPPISVINLGVDGSLVLQAGQNVDLGPLPLLSVTPAMPRGSFEYSCRMLDPVTGELLAEDLNLFEVQ